MEHIRPDKINAYMEGQLQGDEVMATEGHLAVCDECFKTFSGMKELGRAMKIGFEKAEASRDCPEDWVLGALVKGELEAQDLGATEKHIKTCGFCLDRTAGYYKANKVENVSFKASEAWKKKAVDILQGGQEAELVFEKKNTGFAKVYELFGRYSRQLPPLPGYALAAAMAVLLILAAMPEKTKVITISSTEKLAFKSDGGLSSFGFMGTERVDSFAGMEISKSGGKLEFGWKEIPGASEYAVTITEKTSGEGVLSEFNTREPRVSIFSEKLRNNELYSWSIGGTTKDGEAFEYTGEFVITQ